jgi:hypothetical protein
LTSLIVSAIILLPDVIQRQVFQSTLKKETVMTNRKTPIAQAINAVEPVAFVSITDIGLQHGTAENRIDSCAEFALDHIKGFPVLKDVSPEDIKSLRDGYSLAHREIYKAVTYAVINGQYFPATPEQLANKKVEKIEATIDYAMSFTSNQMGTDFKDNPNLKTVVEKVRKAHLTYISDKLGKLVDKAEKILRIRTGVKVERQVVLFADSMKKIFDAQEKSVKVKHSQRKDATANPEKYKLAVEAFWQAYKA